MSDANLSIESKDIEVVNGIAALYLKHGDPRIAHDMLLLASKIDPSNLDSRRLLSLSLLRLDAISDAKQVLDAAQNNSLLAGLKSTVSQLLNRREKSGVNSTNSYTGIGE